MKLGGSCGMSTVPSQVWSRRLDGSYGHHGSLGVGGTWVHTGHTIPSVPSRSVGSDGKAEIRIPVNSLAEL